MESETSPLQPENPFKPRTENTSTPQHPFAKSIKKNRQRNWLLWTIPLILIGLGLLYYFYNSGKGKIVILDTNKDIVITLNNREIKTKSESDGYSIPAFAGQYRIQITKPSYLPFIQDIQLKRGETLKIRPAYAFQPTSQKSEVATVDYVRPSLDQKSVFYLADNRKTIYRMEIANQVKIPLTDSPLKGVTDIQWSSEPDVALITQNDGVFLREIPKFDYNNQTLVKLGGSEIISPIWDPLNPERIAFAYFPTSGERSLVFSDKRLSSLDRKMDIRDIPSPKLVWSDNDAYIMLIGRSADYAKNNIWIYKTTDGSMEKITDTGNIVDASFSPNSDTILYESRSSSSNSDPSNLSLMKIDGSSKVTLDIKGKVAKTTWRDNSSFFLPSSDSNTLTAYTTDGKKESVAFSFPTSLAIEGMHYFASSKTLIFWTASSIYTIELSL